MSENCTSIRNQGFPSSLPDSNDVAYEVRKCASEVCSLRLDFRAFTIRGPADTLENQGSPCLDTFKVSVSIVPLIKHYYR